MIDQALSKTACLSGTVLKLIAVVSMTIDHIGYIFYPGVSWWRILGRLAFPVFAYMIAEGCYYTKNKKKYFGMVLGIGILCQAAMLIFARSWELNIMFTLALSILLIFLLQWALGRKDVFAKESTAPQQKGVFVAESQALGQTGLFEEKEAEYSGSAACGAKRTDRVPIALRWVLFALVVAFCVFLDYGLTKIVNGFHVDYGLFGILLAVAIYIMPAKYQKLIAAGLCLVVLCIARQATVQWWSLFALIPLALYNGRPGKVRMKYFFYLYYPVHLGILWGIYFLG